MSSKKSLYVAVIEIVADISIPDAVRTLSEHQILSAPVRNPEADQTNSDWRERYLGIIDYSAVLLWVLESAEQASSPSSATSAATTAVGIGGAGAVGAIGAVALGVTGPAAVAGLTAAAVCSAVAGSAVGKIGETLVYISLKFEMRNSCTDKNNK